jgi:hypothetical protein
MSVDTHVCNHKILLAAWCTVCFGVFMPRPSHHGENAHHMEEIPESRGPASNELPGLSKGSVGQPPAEVKRAMHPDYAKRETEKNKNRAQTKQDNPSQK